MEKNGHIMEGRSCVELIWGRKIAVAVEERGPHHGERGEREKDIKRESSIQGIGQEIFFPKTID